MNNLKYILAASYFILTTYASALILNTDSLIPGGEITASALDTAKQSMEIIAENIANQFTTHAEDGKAYKAKKVVLQSTPITDEDGNVLYGVAIKEIAKDSSEGEFLYDPSHPHANEKGFVEQSNVKMYKEMTQMMQYSRWIEAEYAVAKASARMIENAFTLNK